MTAEEQADAAEEERRRRRRRKPLPLGDGFGVGVAVAAPSAGAAAAPAHAHAHGHAHALVPGSGGGGAALGLDLDAAPPRLTHAFQPYQPGMLRQPASAAGDAHSQAALPPRNPPPGKTRHVLAPEVAAVAAAPVATVVITPAIERSWSAPVTVPSAAVTMGMATAATPTSGLAKRAQSPTASSPPNVTSMSPGAGHYLSNSGSSSSPLDGRNLHTATFQVTPPAPRTSRCCCCIEVQYDPSTRRAPSTTLALFLVMIVLFAVATIGVTLAVVDARREGERPASLGDLLRVASTRAKVWLAERGGGGLRGGAPPPSPWDLTALRGDVPREKMVDPTTPFVSKVDAAELDATARVVAAHVAAVEAWASSPATALPPAPSVVVVPFSLDYATARGLFASSDVFVMYGAWAVGAVATATGNTNANTNSNEAAAAAGQQAVKDLRNEGFVRPPPPNVGVLPALVLQITATGARVVHAESITVDRDLPPCVRMLVDDPADERVSGARPIKRRVVVYCSLSTSASDSLLGKPHVAMRRFLRPFAPFAMLMRSTGYPLFSDVATTDSVALNHARASLLVSAAVLVQDDSVIPFAIVKRHMDTVRVFGTYAGFADPSLVPEFRLAELPASVAKALFQKDLSAAASAGPLPFKLGHRVVVGPSASVPVTASGPGPGDVFVKRSGWKGSLAIVASGRLKPPPR